MSPTKLFDKCCLGKNDCLVCKSCLAELYHVKHAGNTVTQELRKYEKSVNGSGIASV